MLKNYPVYTTLPVTDYARARAFCKDKLGLTPTEPDGDIFECGKGAGFVISSMSAKPAGHTQMSFQVEDVAAVVKQLKSKGVVFEEYDLPTLKTVDSIAVPPISKQRGSKTARATRSGSGSGCRAIKVPQARRMRSCLHSRRKRTM